MTPTVLLVPFALAALAAASMAAEVPGPDLAFFESKVQPLLARRCYECHAHETKIKGGLALDSRSGWEVGGETGRAVVPGDPEASLLIKAVRYASHDLQMPPKGRLPAEEIATFEQWVRIGAPDPRTLATRRAKAGVDIAAGRQHWAFQPVQNPQPPAPANSGWALDPVDRFILAGLENAGLRPAPDAGRHAWIRRVSLDLTGLPPTPEHIRGFVEDASPEAHAKVVDRLLNSPAFGERWARHWLDLTGFADQIGTSNDVFAEHAWRYRDYLIAAFNADKPFDRFIREQIAGDLLPFSSPREHAEQITATGFLVLGDVEIVSSDKLKMEVDLVDQQVSKTGSTFLAMTLGCARCHDHKFDPIGIQDYYAIAGIFRSTSSTHKIPNGIWSSVNHTNLPETPDEAARRAGLAAQHDQLLARLRAERLSLEHDKTNVLAQLDRPDADKKALTAKRDDIAARLRKLATEIEHAEFFAPAPPQAFAVHDVDKPSDMRTTIRGNPNALGPSIPRGLLRVATWAPDKPITQGSGRLQLAEWLASPQNPLTARVAVNRIWQKLFGDGIVRSVDYFGIRGEKPSNPALLDHLATRFMRNGWSQKRLIRDLVLTRAYRMGSDSDDTAARLDPDNRLLWRMAPQRLDAEAIRDAMLAVSGRLVPSSGGPALPLEYPENVQNLAPKAVNPPSFRINRFRPWQEFERTVYQPIIRSGPQPGPARLRDVFDFVQPAQMSGQRSQTVVPTQSLFLINGDLIRSRAGDIARRIVAQHEDRTSRLEALWLLVLNRPITTLERHEAAAFLDRIEPLVRSGRDSEAAWLELSHALLASNEFLHRL